MIGLQKKLPVLSQQTLDREDAFLLGRENVSKALRADGMARKDVLDLTVGQATVRHAAESRATEVSS